MPEIAWETAHSVDLRASLPFAWAYMTNAANWSDPPSIFEIEGPFEAGTWGTTLAPGQEPRRWQLTKVSPHESYVIEMPLDGAAVVFEWRYCSLDTGGTRLTQHITLTGENAGAYVEALREAFAASLAAGMTRIASAIEVAAEA